MGDLSRNFSRSEIQCQCGCGKDDISPYLIERLQAVRNIYAKPMEITSGVRCKAHNEAVGGVKNSAHVRGLAVDIGCSSSKQRAQMLPILWSQFKRIFIGQHFIHIDIDDSKPSPRIGDYYKADHVA